MADTPIRKVYPDGKIVISNVRRKVDGSSTSYSVVTQWYDGTTMSDAKVDTFGIYSKYRATGEYLRENLPNWGENFLEVDTMSAFRGLSAYNILLLRVGYYKGVRLNGYYTKGDTPISILYRPSQTTDSDNGYSIIVVGTLKFQHDFKGEIDLKYAGVKGDLSVTDRAIIQKVLDGKPKIVHFPTQGNILLDQSLNIQANTGVTLNGRFCNVSFANGVDGVVFKIVGQTSGGSPTDRQNVTNINDFVSSNQVTAQTFIDAESAHHLHVSGCRTDGMKLFMKARDCYFSTIEKNMIFSVYQAFDFQEATNAFNIIGNSIHGAGIASYFKNNTTGGNIIGNCFEASSGGLWFDGNNMGLNISGNYFEGYNEREYYIKLEGGSYQICQGFNITGNLFYSGALYGIITLSCKNISITGNKFGTKHAIRQYCFDGVRNSDINYIGNSWDSEAVGASEFDYWGSKITGLIAGDIKTASRFLPTDNTDVTNINDDIIEYNKAGTPVFKSYNREYVKGFSTTLLAKQTVASQVEALSFNLSKLSAVSTIYVCSGNGENKINEYRLIRSVNNPTQLFLKTIDDSDYSGIGLNVNAGGDGLNFNDTIGGRYLQVIVSG